jgi:hypothetical protein
MLVTLRCEETRCHVMDENAMDSWFGRTGQREGAWSLARM